MSLILSQELLGVRAFEFFLVRIALNCALRGKYIQERIIWLIKYMNKRSHVSNICFFLHCSQLASNCGIKGVFVSQPLYNLAAALKHRHNVTGCCFSSGPSVFCVVYYLPSSPALNTAPSKFSAESLTSLMSSCVFCDPCFNKREAVIKLTPGRTPESEWSRWNQNQASLTALV